MIRLRDAKTGDRSVWLAEPAVALLRDLPRAPEDTYVFPSPRGRREPRPVGQFRKPWRALAAAGLPADLPPYVLRHTFASESEALGHSPYLTAELLGHAVRRRYTTRGYVHHISDDVRRASERVARRIAAALDGEGPGQVVELRGAAS